MFTDAAMGSKDSEAGRVADVHLTGSSATSAHPAGIRWPRLPDFPKLPHDGPMAHSPGSLLLSSLSPLTAVAAAAVDHSATTFRTATRNSPTVGQPYLTKVDGTPAVSGSQRSRQPDPSADGGLYNVTDPMAHQVCRVCNEPAAGFHFGAFTCEGCKSFFGRTCNAQTPVITECKNDWMCTINKRNRTACKACRLRKCLTVGMSKSGSRYGRRSNWFKIHCLMQQHQASGNAGASANSDSSGAIKRTVDSTPPLRRSPNRLPTSQPQPSCSTHQVQQPDKPQSPVETVNNSGASRKRPPIWRPHDHLTDVDADKSADKSIDKTAVTAVGERCEGATAETSVVSATKKSHVDGGGQPVTKCPPAATSAAALSALISAAMVSTCGDSGDRSSAQLPGQLNASDIKSTAATEADESATSQPSPIVAQMRVTFMRLYSHFLADRLRLQQQQQLQQVAQHVASHVAAADEDAINNNNNCNSSTQPSSVMFTKSMFADHQTDQANLSRRSRDDGVSNDNSEVQTRQNGDQSAGDSAGSKKSFNISTLV